MPRIGTGEAGGSWNIVEGIIQDALVSRGIRVTVYDLPSRRADVPRQPALDFPRELVDEVHVIRRAMMGFQIVLLSGSVASGKTTLVQQLRKNFASEHFHELKTKELIRDLARKRLGHELPAERRTMQEFGEKLDREIMDSGCATRW